MVARPPIVYWVAAVVVCVYLITISYTRLSWKNTRPTLSSGRIPRSIYDAMNIVSRCTLPRQENERVLGGDALGLTERLVDTTRFAEGTTFDTSLKQIEDALFPTVKPTSVLSLASSVNTAALCSTVSPSAPCHLSETFSRPDPAVMRSTLEKIYSVFAGTDPCVSYIEHHVASALHNAELQHTSPPVTDGEVTAPYMPSVPLFHDHAPSAPHNIIPDNELLTIYSTAESQAEMKMHTQLSDIVHTSTHFHTRATRLSPAHCSVPAFSLDDAPRPLVVFVVSADMPLEHVPRAIRILRDHCVPAHRIPVYEAPVMVVLPPALDVMAGSLAALLHDFPDVEVVSATEYRGSIAHAVNELVQMRVDHSFARLQDEGRGGEGKWRGVSRVAVLHLGSLRLSGPPVDAQSPMPLLADMLDVLSSPADAPLPPRLCVAHQPPTTAGSLGLSVLPLPTFSDDIPRNSLLIDAKEVNVAHWQQPLPNVADAEGTASTSEVSLPAPSWFARTSPAAQVHSCAALFTTLMAKTAQESRPAHVAPTLVRYSSLPLPLTPALTQPMVNVAQQHAETKNLHAGNTLLVALDQPRVHQPQRVAVFSSHDTQRYKVPRAGVLAHASAYAARAQGPGYSYTALVGLRADEVVQWNTLATRCDPAAPGDCSALESMVAASVLGNHEMHRVPLTTPDGVPYIALVSVLRYSRKVTLKVRDLPLWPHAPKMMTPLARLPDGRCIASTELEVAAKPAHTAVPLALSSSLILRGESQAWGHARVAALLESLTMNMEDCASVVWPADLPRPADVVPPVHPSQPHVPFPTLTAHMHAPIDAIRAALTEVVPQLLTTLPAPPAHPPAPSALPPAVVRHNVLIPTLGTGDSPIAGGFMGYVNIKDFGNDVSPVTTGTWRADAMNGMYSLCLAREQPVEVFAQQLMAERGDTDLVTARKQAALALAKLRRSPLGMMVESVRDSMLVVRDYYEGRSTLKPMVFPHPPLVELTVWVGYDAGDKAWDNHRSLAIMRSALAMLVGDLPFQLRPVRLQGFRSSPNWIWNALVHRAHDANGDFFLQINDDVTWHTKHWLHVALQNMMVRPVPGFGVMGPRDLGRADIFQQTLFGRRHVEIVGGYTHPRFRNYHGDDFVSHLYGADKRVMRGLKMIVRNPMGWSRYDSVGMAEELMARWRQEEQSRVLSYLELYDRLYTATYRTLLGEWARDKYKVFINEDTYEQPTFYAF